MPLVERGLVNLFPDPCNFDTHLRDQMMRMAELRSAETGIDIRKEEPRLERLAQEDLQRGFLSLPPDVLRSKLSRAKLQSKNLSPDEILRDIEELKKRDVLAVLQDDSFVGSKKGDGQFNLLKVAPNFEIAIYLAQATGSSIVTDSLFRWKEIRTAVNRRAGSSGAALSALSQSIEGSIFAFPQNIPDIETLASDTTLAAYPALMRDVFKYLSKLCDCETKPNVEERLSARFARLHSAAQTTLRMARIRAKGARISCVFPAKGIQANAVNRLLLMSSSENHLTSVPMAFFIKGQVPS
jgi:hypothetical protein